MRGFVPFLLLLLGCPAPGDDKNADADIDGDGWGGDADCDDNSAAVHPGADEVCDGFDNDCSGAVDDDPIDGTVYYADADGDAYGDDDAGLAACATPEGYATQGGDCDDRDGAANPGAVESCDGIDDDCDGEVDEAGATGESTWYADDDGDGFGDAAAGVVGCDAPDGYVADATDCDDLRDDVNPAATEVCDDAAVDEDCDGVANDDDDDVTGQSAWYDDADGDGFGDPATGLDRCEQPAGYVLDDTDCDDGAFATNPAGSEVCDSGDVDEDCDGVADDADPSVSRATYGLFYADTDGDAYGDAASNTSACDAPSGYSAYSTDCDDTVPAIHPGATEVCDGTTDEDCDGLVDDDDPGVSSATFSVWNLDADGDGYGGATTVSACAAPSPAYVADASDCDDASAAIHPRGAEVCDAADTDEDCDGLADDADPSATGQAAWYVDADGDGYGDSATTDACDLPAGYAAVSGDCDDAAPFTYPGAVEVCDASDVDEDCDGLADDADASAAGATKSTFYADGDGDGYGTSVTTATTCDAPDGYVTDASDCDDAALAINPAAQEVCDAADTDEDCDGVADDADASASTGGRVTTYADVDHDGYGDPGVASARCDTDADWVIDYTDCDDTIAAVNPAATETCATSYDDDCDGDTNEVGAVACTNFYPDADTDGYGAGGLVCECAGTGAHPTALPGDCDDADASIFPTAAEVCDGVDQDCDRVIDDGMTLFYVDADLDGYGDDSEVGSCTSFPDAVTVGEDCDDGDPDVNPLATEMCDAYDVDENCDGYADDADPSVSDQSAWYPDDDLDGYGDDSASAFLSCEEPEGYVDDDTDCDDGDITVNPGETEHYGDSVDDNCDGSTSPTRTYCTPNVGSGRTYASVSAAVSAHASSICLASGTYSYTGSTLTTPIAGQGMGSSTYSGPVNDAATDLTLTASYFDDDATFTRVHITGYLSLRYGDSMYIYDSIVDGYVMMIVSAFSSADGYGTLSAYNTWFKGGASYTFNFSASSLSSSHTAYARVYCYGCTIEAGTTGLYYLDAGSHAVTAVYVYNSVYESGTSNYTATGSSSTATFSRTSSSSSFSLLDTSYQPPLPTGSLLNAGSSSYGSSTDFWSVTRGSRPDLGAVEAN
jgi:hypothetical protein